MKILITGFSGFVSRHFLNLIDREVVGAQVLGIDKYAPDFESTPYKNLDIQFEKADLLSREVAGNMLDSFKPDYILHLASVSSVAQSWHTPYESFVNNTNIFLNVVEQIRLNQSNCRILSVGSSEEFGQVNESELPLTEEHPLKPLSPYAVARVSQEMLSKIYADGFGLDIIMTRSFNHFGPGQKENFVISSFAKQLVTLSKNENPEKTISTGDLMIIRDFVDVRDVVKAYYMLLLNGRKGEIYNICSGKGLLLKDMIKIIGDLLGIEVKTKLDEKLVRPNENKTVIGSYIKIKKELGWEPGIPLEKSLEDIIAYWQTRV